MKSKTYLRPGSRGHSWTYWNECECEQPDDPFEMIDTESSFKETDYGKSFDDFMCKIARDFYEFRSYIEDCLAQEGNRVDVDFNWKAWSNCAYLDEENLAALLATVYYSSSKVTYSFPTKYRADECLWNLFKAIIDKLPEDQQPLCWDELKSYGSNSNPIGWFSGQGFASFRIAALALMLCGDSNWARIRDKQQKDLDGLGDAILISSSKESLEEITQRTKESSGCYWIHDPCSCIHCGKSISLHEDKQIQLNRYSYICPDCVRKLYSELGSNAE